MPWYAAAGVTIFLILFALLFLGWGIAEDPRQEARAGVLAAVCLAAAALVKACTG